MPQPRFKQIIFELPFAKKLIIASAILMAVSLFLPWYQDTDTFHTGQVFTGLTGPLYLVGLTFLIISSLSIVFPVIDYLNKKTVLFPIKTSKTYLGMGIFSFYLLFVVNSVYFDSNFGINLIQKESGFGMFIAFIAAALLTTGGYLNTRDQKNILSLTEENTSEQFIPMPEIKQQKPRENLRTVQSHSPPVTKDTLVEEKEPVAVQNTNAVKKIQPFRMDL